MGGWQVDQDGHERIGMVSVSSPRGRIRSPHLGKFGDGQTYPPARVVYGGPLDAVNQAYAYSEYSSFFLTYNTRVNESKHMHRWAFCGICMDAVYFDHMYQMTHLTSNYSLRIKI